MILDSSLKNKNTHSSCSPSHETYVHRVCDKNCNIYRYAIIFIEACNHKNELFNDNKVTESEE